MEPTNCLIYRKKKLRSSNLSLLKHSQHGGICSIINPSSHFSHFSSSVVSLHSWHQQEWDNETTSSRCGWCRVIVGAENLRLVAQVSVFEQEQIEVGLSGCSRNKVSLFIIKAALTLVRWRCVFSEVSLNWCRSSAHWLWAQLIVSSLQDRVVFILVWLLWNFPPNTSCLRYVSLKTTK